MAQFQPLVIQSTGQTTRLPTTGGISVGDGGIDVINTNSPLILAGGATSQDIQITSGHDLVALGGTTDVDFSASSGIFKTPTGEMTLGGTLTGGITLKDDEAHTVAFATAAAVDTAGSALSFTGETGGAYSAGAPGAGGAINLTGGVGGAYPAGTGAAGGTIAITGGTGGAGTTGGGGGGVDIDAGVAGAGGSPTNGTVDIGLTNASAVNIGKTGLTTTVKGDLDVDEDVILGTTSGNTITANARLNADGAIDVTGATTLSIGATTATKVELGRTGQLTEVLGNFKVTGTSEFIGDSTFDDANDVTFKGNVIFGDKAALPDNVRFNSIVISNEDTKAIAYISGTGATINTPTHDIAFWLGVSEAVGEPLVISGVTSGAAAGSAVTIMGGNGFTDFAGGNVNLVGGAGIGAANGGDISILGGLAGATSGTGGNVYIDAGYQSAPGTGGGTIYIGRADAAAIAFSRSGVTTAVYGTVTLQSGAELNTTGTGMIDLPSLFEINNVAVSANVTAANLTELTGGGVTALHTHSSGTATEMAFAANTSAMTGTSGYVAYVSGAGAVDDAIATAVATSRCVGVNKDQAASGHVSTGPLVTVYAKVGDEPTPGDPCYLSHDVAGRVQKTAPSTATQVVAELGVCHTGVVSNQIVMVWQPKLPILL